MKYWISATDYLPIRNRNRWYEIVSVRIFIFRETTKFLFTLQTCHISAYLKLYTNTPKSRQNICKEKLIQKLQNVLNYQ